MTDPNDHAKSVVRKLTTDFFVNIEQALQATLEESSRYHTFEKLSEILDPEIIEQGFQQAGIATVRKRRLPLEAVLWSVIGMALFRK